MTIVLVSFFYLSSLYICTLFHAYHPDPGSSGFSLPLLPGTMDSISSSRLLLTRFLD
ncbi:hypothetical protein GGI42DRAFT_317544 [Trichoderma sp. SZMC 28013]